MRKIFLALAATAALVTAAFGAARDSDGETPRVISVSVKTDGPVHQRVTLGLNKATVVQLDVDARDVLVANPEIVDAVVRTPRRIILLAQKSGQTNAFFFDGAGRQILALDIRVEKDVTDLAALIKKNMPGSDIKISAMNDNVVLSGKVENALQSTRAQDIAARFAGDPAKVVNMLQIGSSEQVMLKVRIAEMQRSVAKQFGVDASAAMQAAGVPIALSTTNQFGLLGHALNDLSGGQVGSVCPQAFTPQVTKTITSTTASGDQTVTTVTNGVPDVLQTITATAAPIISAATNTSIPCTSPNNVQGVIKALEVVGLVHMLAEPNLTAVSGETAKFLAGGEFPVPAGRDSQGNISISFKQFGVGLSFTPVVLSAGRISLQLSTEVSELTNTGAYTLQGSTPGSGLVIPALSVRRAETTIELPSGGSFAVAGLMQHNTKQVIEGFPGVKDMPILGALFRSRDFQNDETELVVLVTAYLVRPTTEAKLAAPTDGFVAPADVETILLGRLNAIYKKGTAPISPQDKVGFIVQ